MCLTHLSLDIGAIESVRKCQKCQRHVIPAQAGIQASHYATGLKFHKRLRYDSNKRGFRIIGLTPRDVSC